jgi:hypothetical protein
MKKNKKGKQKYLILTLLFLFCLPSNAYCNTNWEHFLTQPDEKSLLILGQAIALKAQNCNWGSPNNKDVVPTEKNAMQLFDLIKKGNQFAFGASLLVYKCWDGGVLEDFYRSTGMFFEKEPSLFLQIIKEKSIADSEINYMLTMLPLDTTDNIDRQIYMVENRINILKKINIESLNEMKRKGLLSLQREKDDLYRISKEIKEK